MATNQKNLLVIVAELINRMSPEEKEALISNLDSSTIRYLTGEDKNRQYRRYLEPEIYVRVAADHISFEMPETKILEFVMRLPRLLKEKRVKIRFNKNGAVHAKSVSTASLLKTLRTINEALVNGVVTIEFGNHTLFSTGSGCMLLETDLPAKEKRKIAFEFLKLSGYSVKVKSVNFSVGVIEGEVKVREE